MSCTGCFAFQVFGGGGLPTVLPICPLCHEVGIDIQHVLRHCPQVNGLSHAWHREAGFEQILPWSRLQLELFGGRFDPYECAGLTFASRVRYVVHALQRFAKALLREAYLESSAIVTMSVLPAAE